MGAKAGWSQSWVWGFLNVGFDSGVDIDFEFEFDVWFYSGFDCGIGFDVNVYVDVSLD